MYARRGPIAAALAAGFAVLTGCSSVQQQHTSENGDFLSQSVKAFSGAGKLRADAGEGTWTAVTVELAGDLLDPPPSRAALVVAAARASLDTPTAARPHLGDRPAEDAGTGGRAEVTFHFSSEGRDACGSGDSVGPVEIVVSDGSVSAGSPPQNLGPRVRDLLRGGRFALCAETRADFDGAVAIDELEFQFGDVPPRGETVEICHIPPGNPDARHTITVGAAAVRAHLRHGDLRGPCPEDSDDADEDGDGVLDADDECPQTPADETVDEFGCSCSQYDGDGDGVNDCDDACPDTPNGDVVDDAGCSVVMLDADAGPDLTAVEGDSVTITGSGRVVQGEYDEADLSFAWSQTAGPAVPHEATGTELSLDVTGMTGDLTFTLTVATQDGSAVADDSVVVTVREAQIVDLVAGRWHNALLTENDRTRLWGWDRYGQLGDGSLSRGITSTDAGPTHTIVRTLDGAAWTWGSNVLAGSSSPVQVDGVSDVVQVSALLDGGIMLDGTGAVWGFTDEEDRFCRLGEQSDTDGDGVLGPVTVPGLPANIVSVASGTDHTVALDADGVAWVWGGSRFGCTPFPALDNVAAIEAGDTNVCLFIRNDGTAWAMGFNFYGQLGNGTTVSNYSTPTQVVGLSDVVAVAGGQYHSLFLTADGTVWVTGWNHDCQLGLGDETVDRATVPTALDLSDVALIAAGNTHSLAVRADNTVWAWGANNVGQLSGGTQSALANMVCAPAQVAVPTD